ncbi:MAG TPA: bifunctional diaminohydroxyphosphoribosylaminopyrimidine deaminase/5-amino-6-(5-phosphoribosylamino)uracil reductase RibD, partial [Gemmatimonadales bacterium]|nr:bifunctional diaminohydroxyphosphoribosylaminopyrimidine deaminase/5-amino-6-(5-phosphoribosylamino)uracil reductase RibD [Gemmatimonadales bacterium]
RGSSSPASACEWASSERVNEQEAMAHALDLAWRGWGRVQPNPLVGAVILQDGELVGQGWHPEYGDRHAEAVALADAGDRARGATMVVTLEPCSHQGKQPPCTEAIIHAGIGRVVAALRDPNPVAAGGGEQLRTAGIEVELGASEDAAAAQNAIFLHTVRNPSRPYVALKLATTLNGRIADRFGRSRWISGEQARDYVQWLRAGFDAIGVGGRTARVDDPSLTVRGAVRPRILPRRVVFDSAADLGPQLTLVRTATETPTIAVVASGADPTRVRRLEGAGVTVLTAANLNEALASLRQLGIESLLVEGGGQLAGALLAAGLVDRYYWLQAPLWLGEDAVPAITGLPSRELGQAERWRVIERRPLGEDTLLVLDRT